VRDAVAGQAHRCARIRPVRHASEEERLQSFDAAFAQSTRNLGLEKDDGIQRE
jgi:hypothetical protein